MHEQEHQHRADGENLHVELDDPDASLAVERTPRVHEADGAGATKELGHDLSAEGAVKRNDSVLIVRQHRGLDTNQLGVSREDDENTSRRQKEQNAYATNREPCHALRLVRVTRRSVESQKRAHANSHIE